MSDLGVKFQQNIESVEDFTFEPIKGYPMLHWKGKRPFTSTQFYPAQLKETYGKETDGWMNKIFWGDNLQVMSHLLKEYRGQIDLIYIDPPFDSKADYKKKIEVRGKKTSNDSTVFEEKQYTDIWSNDEYLQFMYERLILLRELLSDKGTIYLHCDWHKAHLLRCLMDEVFGQSNFRNEITWRRQVARGMKVYAEYYAFSSDYLLIYSKDASKATWHRQVRTNLISLEEADKKYMKDERGYFRTSDPGSYTFESLVELNSQGRLYAPNNGSIIVDEDSKEVYGSNGGKVAIKYYREIVGNKVKEEVTVDNIWDDIPGMGVVSSEYLGYPTQKPEALLERVISASTDEGDLVFDCFMGSGTTQAVAMKLGRRYIGADINLGAIDTTVKRLLQRQKELSNSTLFDSACLYSGFEVYNVNNYDVFRNPIEAKDLLKKALELQDLPANELYDGEKDGRMVKIMPINRIATRADLNELIMNFPYALFDKRKADAINKPVELITLVCMGHEPDLGAQLELQMKEAGYIIDVEVVDILRDKTNLEFKRESEAEIVKEGNKLVIRDFYPLNLMNKLSMQREVVDDWRILTDSVKIDVNYDGAVFSPTVIDVPDDGELVIGVYEIPENAGNIRVKITDLLSESYEVTIR
ncbi:MAG: site-specific DNA-methyltransferase [Candidatus Cryptobacteroides sp.]|nr:site-specific DNA-methyltransferase [Candidatus Cryptobacteroides sp.]